MTVVIVTDGNTIVHPEELSHYRTPTLSHSFLRVYTSNKVYNNRVAETNIRSQIFNLRGNAAICVTY